VAVEGAVGVGVEVEVEVAAPSLLLSLGIGFGSAGASFCARGGGREREEMGEVGRYFGCLASGGELARVVLPPFPPFFLLFPFFQSIILWRRKRPPLAARRRGKPAGPLLRLAPL
jgi:hypothetical protein